MLVSDDTVRADIPDTCSKCGYEDFAGAAFCTQCGKPMLSPAQARVRGRWLIGSGTLGLVFLAPFLFISFGTGKERSLAQAAFLVFLNAGIAAMSLAHLTAGWFQITHGRRNGFVRWVIEWLTGPLNPHG